MASASANDKSSRIPNFFRMALSERIAALHQRKLLTDQDLELLHTGDHTLRLPVADKMIENVVGIMGLPLGVGLNFLINGRDYVVPLCVEEPSIVAGLSGAARIARLGGGYTATTTEPILIGQVQAVNIADPEAAMAALMAAEGDIVNLANSLHPKMTARGGGARAIEVFHHVAPEDGRDMVVVHLHVDTRDAMGANLVNSMCEGIASLVESITGGKVFLRILSNLTDRALVKASVSIPVQNLTGKGYTGEQVRDGIILANDLALVDPYRAATHNKGIMNGVDAVALATGNDWRALESAAHAYAAREGQYKALTRWYKGDNGDLVGEIDMPMKVGTVGGSLETNPTVRINHRLLGSPNATELASVMGTVGLAQNFAALRSLSTDGIQQNHMTLHARSVVSSAGVPDDLFEAVVEALIETGEIKVWKARELTEQMLKANSQRPEDTSRMSACGKIILLGEHAVVYGRPALAVPISLAVEACVQPAKSEGQGVQMLIPRWGVEQQIRENNNQGISGSLYETLQVLGLEKEQMTIEVFPHLPKAVGLGGSAALAVAVIRALDVRFELGLGNERINALAFECEKAAHGTPSGIDNTLATYGNALLYQNTGTPEFSHIAPGKPLHLAIGLTGKESLTAQTVGAVRSAWKRHQARYDGIFDQIGSLTNSAAEAFRAGHLTELGELMNLCQGYLNALQLSTPELEELNHIARERGSLGAKLTGGGGGGSMIALCESRDHAIDVLGGMEAAGYSGFPTEVN